MTTLILGATKGLGKSITEICIAKQWPTIEVGSSTKDGKDGDRTFLNCDLACPESVESFLVKLRECPPVTNFFWVAGALLKGNFIDHNSAELRRIVDINFRNVLPIVSSVWKNMQNSNSGSHFVAIASSSGKKARYDEAAYVASKFAQVGFVRSLGLENSNPNLKISLFLPGGMKTQLWDNFPNSEYDNFMDPRKVAEYVLQSIADQTDSFLELEIPRGSV